MGHASGSAEEEAVVSERFIKSAVRVYWHGWRVSLISYLKRDVVLRERCLLTQ